MSAGPMELARSTLEDGVSCGPQEIEQRKHLEEKFRYLASHDELTGLPKWSPFLELHHQALLIAGRMTHGIAVCFIDVDGLKEVNDRSVDIASRYGGDEFNLLLVDPGDRKELSRIADKILQAITERILIEWELVSVTARPPLVFSTLRVSLFLPWRVRQIVYGTYAAKRKAIFRVTSRHVVRLHHKGAALLLYAVFHHIVIPLFP